MTRRLCLADVQRYVGAPPSPTNEVYQFEVGGLVLWAWRDAAFGARKGGWFCAVSCTDIVLEVSWVNGDKGERDAELARQVGLHADLAQAAA